MVLEHVRKVYTCRYCQEHDIKTADETVLKVLTKDGKAWSRGINREHQLFICLTRMAVYWFCH